MPRLCLVGLAYLFGAIVSQNLEPVAPRVAVSSEPSSHTATTATADVEQEASPVNAAVAVTGVKRTLASRVASNSPKSEREDNVVTVACNDDPSIRREPPASELKGTVESAADSRSGRQVEQDARIADVGVGAFELDASDMGPVLPDFESAVPARVAPIARAVAEHIGVESSEDRSVDAAPSRLAEVGEATSADSRSEADPEAKETVRDALEAEIASTLPERQLPQDADQVVAPSELSQPTDEVKRAPLTPELIALRKRVQTALDIYRNRTLNTRDNGAWSIMHSFISYGVDKQLRVGGPTGRPVNAIGWICFNYPCRGERLFYVAGQHIQGRRGPGFQGHDGQFLAMLAQSRVRIDYPMKVGNRDFTVADLVAREKQTCQPGTELTFKLIGLSHYLDADETWQSEKGERWDIARLVQEELGQPIVGAACGGTHRLFGLSYAVNRRKRAGKPVDGQYRRADVYIRDYQDYTFKLQNRDGSFSTEFFAGRGGQYDPARRLLTTGHIAEWLAFSLPADQLQRPEMVRAMGFLTKLLIDGQRRELKVGPQGHALHALAIYNQRAWDVASKVQTGDALTSTD